MAGLLWDIDTEYSVKICNKFNTIKITGVISRIHSNTVNLTSKYHTSEGIDDGHARGTECCHYNDCHEGSKTHVAFINHQD
jgi:hypothetical protein